MLVTSPARLYAMVAGAALLLAGILGFFANADFTSDESVRGELFDVFAVNGWLNVVHVVSGLIGLACVARFAREFALTCGLFYLVLAVWGFIVGGGDSILSILPVNTADNLFHVVLGVAGVLTGLMSPSERSMPKPAPPSAHASHASHA